ncbi:MULTISPECIES: hypothetical protein [Vibrio]|uniref:Uncharacterized protein n=1 Tax=Vibrio hepatarius TaxID=171383 RepID=A0A0M0HUN8_9VIBR|nr:MULTISPECIES: hypothetical protein [Vibrio]KOO05785.1 hypothetical protein AKJ31_20450 [Vibrio hepatarius]POC39061.1 hypothetical protein CRN55_07485 [Vibrio vulnificus]
MEIETLLTYLTKNGWKESTSFADHFSKENTNGFVAIDKAANEAYIIEQVGGIPWSRITNIEQFEQDLGHLQL